MAPDMLQRCRIIGEFSYIKMMVVMILETWNQERKVKGELAVEEGPLKNLLRPKRRWPGVLCRRHITTTQGDPRVLFIKSPAQKGILT